ncbi:MAG: SAM-dependent methyltransferase [Tepidisphaeraceae bacterium]|jgi:23S rRNA (cytidine1920-2'-O)/16S rRNA (cytidine1409-2'-O)-methyltransferase
MQTFVSRAGRKLDHAIAAFAVDVTGKTCADLGCNAGGFTHCLLQRGAAKVFAIDTGYGALDWKLRNDPRVVVMERTNAMHVELPQPVQIVAIDVGWTRQRHILPPARRMLAAGGIVLTLIKPHYEAAENVLRRGVLPEAELEGTLAAVRRDAEEAGFVWVSSVPSPIKGHGGNVEVLALLRPADV